MNLCDKCETVSHCTAKGCIPLTECVNSGQVSAAQVVAHAEAGEVSKPVAHRFNIMEGIESKVESWLYSDGPPKESPFDSMQALFTQDQLDATLAAKQEEVARLRVLLARYRNETPLGNQPHMIAHEVDEILNPNQGETE